MAVAGPIDAPPHILPIELKDSIEGRLIDITTDIGLQIEKNLSKRNHIIFLEILEDRVQLEHFAVDVHLLSDVDSFEKIYTKII